MTKSKNSDFLKKIFTKNELDYCFSKKEAATHLSARFSGKEAVIKALNSIGKKAPTYSKIEISNNKEGMPLVKINDKNMEDISIKISLSHCSDRSIAFAIALEE